MEKIIEFQKYPLNMVLEKLLVDKTTGKRIIWATDGYSEYGPKYCDRFEITTGALKGMNPVLIQPRAFKAIETQQQRTKAKAEVFTPSWIVNKMINHLDVEWFGRPDVFNVEKSQSWITRKEKIDFKDKKWKDYIDRSFLEITCGEAPFIASRYNASTGEIIPIEDRIGVLDRKLRVVTENTDNEEDWIKWVKRAYESVYGYEYQGDNLLIGRINLLMTFVDYYQSIWKKATDQRLLTAITNIITWNFWQMDGLNGTVPLGVPQPMVEQMTLFDVEEEQEEIAPLCNVRKWRMKKTILYKEVEEKEGNIMGKKKWDYIIGNPPYQMETVGNNRSNPVYHLFIDEAKSIGDIVELITPARFLFNAGQTPSKWNEEMLSDPHFSVLDYFDRDQDVFPGTDIKGGVAITFYNNLKSGEPIGVFVPNEDFRTIIKKVKARTSNTLDGLISSRGMNRFSRLFMLSNKRLSSNKSGTGNMIAPNAFDKVPEAFMEKSQSDYYAITGRQNNQRVTKYIFKSNVIDNGFIHTYNVCVPKANGTGLFGEVLSQPFISPPDSLTTDTFINIGQFSTESEAKALKKYIKTRFLRGLLSALKVTQDNPKRVWSLVPDQDFSFASDIDWSVSIPDIDQQLYKKYGLSPEEIDFIETHVKEME